MPPIPTSPKVGMPLHLRRTERDLLQHLGCQESLGPARQLEGCVGRALQLTGETWTWWTTLIRPIKERRPTRPARHDGPSGHSSGRTAALRGFDDNLAKGDQDAMDATLHTSERMVRRVDDRRKVRVAKSTVWK